MVAVNLHERNRGYAQGVFWAMARTTVAHGKTHFLPLVEDRVYGPLIALGSVAVVVVLQAVFAGHPALEALFLLPAYLAYRSGGHRAGAVVLILAAISASVVTVANFELSELALRLLAYGLVGAVVAATSENLGASESPLAAGGVFIPTETDDRPMVAVMVDCDGFLALDEFYGPGSGEHVISMLVKSLEVETRDCDMVARLGTTEFAVVLTDVDSTGATRVMERVQERFERAVVDAGYECTISFGCSPVPTEPQTLEELLAHTDTGPDRGGAYLN